jgi:hypothetical protein
MDLKEIGWEGGVEGIHLAQDRDRWRAVVNAVMNLRVLARRRWLLSYAVPRSLYNFLSTFFRCTPFVFFCQGQGQSFAPTQNNP